MWPVPQLVCVHTIQSDLGIHGCLQNALEMHFQILQKTEVHF